MLALLLAILKRTQICDINLSKIAIKNSRTLYSNILWVLNE